MCRQAPFVTLYTYNFLKRLVTWLHQSTQHMVKSPPSHGSRFTPVPIALFIFQHESCWDVVLAWKGHLTQGCYKQKNSGQLDANRSGRSHLWCTASTMKKTHAHTQKNSTSLLFIFYLPFSRSSSSNWHPCIKAELPPLVWDKLI